MDATHVDQNSFWHRMMPDLETNRYGVISIALLIVGCFGGIAVGLGAVHHTWQLIVVVIPTMITLSLLLAVAPMKHIMNATVLAVVVDVLITLLNFFS